MRAHVKIGIVALVATMGCALLSGCIAGYNDGDDTLHPITKEDIDDAADAAARLADDIFGTVGDEVMSSLSDAQIDMMDSFGEAISAIDGNIDSAGADKTQQIIFMDASTGETVSVLTDKSDIAAFVADLKVSSWKPAPLESVPADANREYTVVLMQQETIKLGQKTDDAKLKELFSLTSYRDSNILTLEGAHGSLDFTTSDDTHAAIGHYAQK